MLLASFRLYTFQSTKQSTYSLVLNQPYSQLGGMLPLWRSLNSPSAAIYLKPLTKRPARSIMYKSLWGLASVHKNDASEFQDVSMKPYGDYMLKLMFMDMYGLFRNYATVSLCYQPRFHQSNWDIFCKVIVCFVASPLCQWLHGVETDPPIDARPTQSWGNTMDGISVHCMGLVVMEWQSPNWRIPQHSPNESVWSTSATKHESIRW